MSRFMNSTELAALEKLLSKPRLGTYLNLTKSGRAEDAVELHQATMSLGVALLGITSLIEVALRNSICTELDITFGGAGWLRSPPSSLAWSALEVHAIKKAESQAKRSEYSKKSHADKQLLDAVAFPQGVPPGIKHKKLAQKRQETINVSDGQVVAQLTFHFWKRLFSEQYENSLWKRSLKRVFPNKTLARPNIANHLEVLYETRNRLAHHEPVFGARLDDTLSSIGFVVENLGAIFPTRESAFAKLIMPQQDILEGQVAIFRYTYTRLCK